MSRTLTLDQTLKLFRQLGSSVVHIPHNSFPYQKSQWKVYVNVVTPQELKMMGREKNFVFCLTAEKNVLFAFDKV